MHRIDDPTAVGSQPSPAAPGTPGYFEVNAVAGTATVMTDDWANDVQEELVQAILAAGITLVKGTQTQLRDAINILASRAALATINYALNPDFKVWQRGVTINSTTPVAGSNNDDSYTADQWILLSNGNNVASVAKETTLVPSGSRQAAKLTVVTANAKFGLLQPLEAAVAVPLRGKQMSLQVKMRRGTSGTITKVRLALVSWSGTADAITSDCVSAWNAEATNPTLATSWAFIGTPVAQGDLTTSYATFKVENLTIPNDCNNLGIFIWSDDASTTVSDELYMGQVKLELGSVITDFVVAPLERELAACRRFVAKSHRLDTAPIDASGADNYEGAVQGIMWGAPSAVDMLVRLPVPMRATPTLSLQCCENGGPAGNWTNKANGANFAGSTSEASAESFILGGTATANGNTWRIHYFATAEL